MSSGPHVLMGSQVNTGPNSLLFFQKEMPGVGLPMWLQTNKVKSQVNMKLTLRAGWLLCGGLGAEACKTQKNTWSLGSLLPGNSLELRPWGWLWLQLTILVSVETLIQ